MSDGNTFDLCPYCHVRQIGAPGRDELYRCHSCNLYICADWLIDDPRDYVLNSDRPWLCPWCAYPVAMVFDFPERDDFLCPGCAGTLNAELLVTQVDLNGERKRSMRGRTYLLLFFLCILFVMFLFSWVIQP